jgi:DegV family protein with EDD domain
MKKIGVIADTNACLDYFDHPYDIRIMRSMIHFDEEEYLDHVELTADAFYKKIIADKSLVPKTSQPSTASMVDLYQGMKDDGYTDIIVVTISSHMSGIYSAAQVAAKKVDGLTVHVVDSKSVAYPEAIMALRAAELAKAGKDVDTIIKDITHIRDNNHIYFAVETLAYLVKNGRLSNAQGFVASMLKIKPLLHISKDGKVENVEKIRTFKKAVNRVIDMYLEETKDKNVTPFICHANNIETRDYIETRLKAADPSIKTVFSMPLTPAVGAHAGPGAIGLGYTIKKG